MAVRNLQPLMRWRGLCGISTEIDIYFNWLGSGTVEDIYSNWPNSIIDSSTFPFQTVSNCLGATFDVLIRDQTWVLASENEFVNKITTSTNFRIVNCVVNALVAVASIGRPTHCGRITGRVFRELHNSPRFFQLDGREEGSINTSLKELAEKGHFLEFSRAFYHAFCDGRIGGSAILDCGNQALLFLKMIAHAKIANNLSSAKELASFLYH